MSNLRKIPASVTLPKTCVTLDSARLLALLGVSRHCLYYWRRDHGFPKHMIDGKHSYVIVASLVPWLRDRGVEVIFEENENE